MGATATEHRTMSMKQLVSARNEVRSALATIQALIDVQVRKDADAARAKRKARPAKVPRSPSKDERVAVIREGAAFAVKRTAQCFNNLRKDGSRSVKVWERLLPDDIEHLKAYIAKRVPEATFELVKPTQYRTAPGMYLRVILPALTQS
jgi:hypothetical protein